MTTSRTTTVAVALTALALAAASAPSLSRLVEGSATAAPSEQRPGTQRARAAAPRSTRPTPRASSHEHYAYGWPVKPFRHQHPVRGFFGDPRIANHGHSRQFHFGVDISAPNGTPVYATITGRVYIHPLHSTTVAIVDADGTEFSYWHILPTVRTGDHAVAYRTMIGRIEKPYGHVHFSERRNGRYLNPLRPGAMGPYADDTRPLVRTVAVRRHSGLLVTETYDAPPVAVPRPWHDLPVMPAVVRWRLLATSGRLVLGWRLAVDFRSTIPPASEFDDIWAPGVRQNRPRTPGRYPLVLTRSLDDLAPGAYVVDVAVGDSRGNATRTRFRVAIPKG